MVKSHFILFENGLKFLYVPNQLVVYGCDLPGKTFIEPRLDASDIEVVRDLFEHDCIDSEFTGELLSQSRFPKLHEFSDRYYSFFAYEPEINREGLSDLMDSCFSGDDECSRIRAMAIYREADDWVKSSR